MACVMLAVAFFSATVAGSTPAQAYPNDFVSYGGGLNGYAYTYDNSNGNLCEFSGNAPYLVSQSGAASGQSCANRDVLWQNLGTPCSGCDYIRIYWGSNYTGAWACETPYWYWSIAGLWGFAANNPPITFSWGSGLSGYGQTVWNNAASMKWAGTCS
jgi:hypothetical protein